MLQGKLVVVCVCPFWRYLSQFHWVWQPPLEKPEGKLRRVSSYLLQGKTGTGTFKLPRVHVCCLLVSAGQTGDHQCKKRVCLKVEKLKDITASFQLPCIEQNPKTFTRTKMQPCGLNPKAHGPQGPRLTFFLPGSGDEKRYSAWKIRLHKIQTT